VSHKRNVETIYPLTKGSVSDKNNSAASSAQESMENDRIPSISVPLESKKPAAVKKEATLHARLKSFRSNPTQTSESHLAPIDLNLARYDYQPTLKNYQDGPAHNIDKRDSDDPFLVTAYVQDMYKYYREQEHRAVVGPYMRHQQAMNATMRAVLVDWLCEVHHKLKFTPETLYLTVNIFDRYLTKKANLLRRELQLIGTTALLIASKYEEIRPANIDDLVDACAGTYPFSEIVETEETILKTLNYQISIPTINNFLGRYLNAAHANLELCYLSSYIAEGSLHSYGMMKKYKPSLLAAAAVLIGRKAIGRNVWSPTLLKYSNYREEDVVPVARDMIAKMKKEMSSYTKLVSLRKKYGSSRLKKVSSISLPSEI
jgi:hypothetical protein